MNEGEKKNVLGVKVAFTFGQKPKTVRKVVRKDRSEGTQKAKKKRKQRSKAILTNGTSISLSFHSKNTIFFLWFDSVFV